MRLVKLMGGHTVRGTAGLAMAWAVVLQLFVWGPAGALSSAPRPVAPW